MDNIRDSSSTTLHRSPPAGATKGRKKTLPYPIVSHVRASIGLGGEILHAKKYGGNGYFRGLLTERLTPSQRESCT